MLEDWVNGKLIQGHRRGVGGRITPLMIRVSPASAVGWFQNRKK